MLSLGMTIVAVASASSVSSAPNSASLALTEGVRALLATSSPSGTDRASVLDEVDRLLSLADEEQLTTYESVLAALEDGWHPLLRDDACGTSAAPAEPDDIAMGIDHLLDIFREEEDERSRRADARMIELEKRVDRLERRLLLGVAALYEDGVQGPDGHV